MTRTDFINNFWSRYMMMEREFIHLSEYVKIDERNYTTFSNEIIKQILHVNVEFENLLNQMAMELGWHLEQWRITKPCYLKLSTGMQL